MSAAHSPLPWRVFEDTNVLSDEEFPLGLVAECDMGLTGEDDKPALWMANAEYIVRACNLFPELVAALDETVHGLHYIYESHIKSEGKGCLCAYCDSYRLRVNLLARARGES